MNPFDTDKQELLELVLERYDTQVPQRHGWASLRCIAPDHVDRQASAAVNAGEGRYYCHACGLQGDGFDLMLELETMQAEDVMVELDLQIGEKSDWLW